MSDADAKAAMMTEASASAGTVLLVDDEPAVLMTLERVLRGVGNMVTCAKGSEAVERIRQGGIDVVVSDINMPEMTGLALLRAIRNYDQDLPVLLITGEPSVESASKAIEYGVFRYLAKPFEREGLRRTVQQASQLYRLARIKREALGLVGVAGASDRIGLEVSFQHALESLHVAFQPIVSISGHSVLGYEALVRTADPAFPGPTQLLDAAERLGSLFDLGRRTRRWAADLFVAAPDDCLLFLNLHPEDLTDADLLDPDSTLAKIAHRTVLEITERASLERVEHIGARIAALRSRGFRIAIDDLGAGYAGLTSFALLEPDTVKLDMTLTRGIEASAVKQRLVSSMAALCAEMGITAVVEGVETKAERDTLIGLKCNLLQGFLFARPGPPFPEPAW